MLYVGVDAHSETSWITVMDEKGKVLKRREISSSRKAVKETLGRYRQPMKATLEASYSWAPIYDWLDEVTDDVVLAHPAKVRAIAEARIKTDKIDSETLAHLLRADLIPQAYHPSGGDRVSRAGTEEDLNLPPSQVRTCCAGSGGIVFHPRYWH
jgi:transposase